jgi:basic membrane protein A and related proteins
VSKRTMAVALVAVLVGSLALVAGLVKSGDSTAAPKAAQTIRVAVVTDIGGLNDRGFNALANQGLQLAKKKLKVQGRVYISRSNADYVPNLSTPARQGYDLVIGNGFLMGDAVAAVAKRFPKTKFAIIDYPWVALKGKPKNARGLVFAEQEAGYLAGVAAATETKTGRVTAVGGQKVPAVDAFIAGYFAGAKRTKKNIQTAFEYSQSFTDQAKCKEIALNQIAGNSDVIFQVAGGCGLGALQAAKEKGVWGIGVDKDQSFEGKHVLTSATKKVDFAVYTTIQQTLQGKFKGGRDGLFNVKNGGVGYGKVSTKAPKRGALIAKLKATSKAIASGKIKGIPRKLG